MATTLYLRSDKLEEFIGLGGTQSQVLPDGTDNSLFGFIDDYTLSTTAGSTQTTTSIATLAQTARQSGRFGSFISPALDTQTISANTWNFTLRNKQTNNNANVYKATSIFVWRPSTASVVGYIYDLADEIGSEWTTNYTNDSSNISGSAVSVTKGDVLICELWYTAAQAKAVSYSADVQIDVNSFIETPQDLVFFVRAKEQSFGTIIE
jgi:hypothetical protein